MTDPISLEPLLHEIRDADGHRNDENLPEDERLAAFTAHVHAGRKVEAGDWMPAS
jgi:hypothetical protein